MRRCGVGSRLKAGVWDEREGPSTGISRQLKQTEEDIQAGKLDCLAAEALEAKWQGTLRELNEETTSHAP